MNTPEIFLSDNLIHLRSKTMLSQRDIANAINVIEPTIHRAESGKGMPHVITLKLLADFWKVTVDDLCFKNLKKQI